MIRDDLPAHIAYRGTFALPHSVYVNEVSGKVVSAKEFLDMLKSLSGEILESVKDADPGKPWEAVMISVPEDLFSGINLTFYSRMNQGEIKQLEIQMQRKEAEEKAERYQQYLALSAEFGNVNVTQNPPVDTGFTSSAVVLENEFNDVLGEMGVSMEDLMRG